jgi:hypothetical protein
MTRTEADEYRAAGIWPARPMTPFEPLPAPRPRGGAAMRTKILYMVTLIAVFAALGFAAKYYLGLEHLDAP